MNCVTKNNRFECFSHLSDVLCGNSKFDSYRSKTTGVGLRLTLKDDTDKKPRLTFMFPILSGQNRKEKESKPAFDLYSNEKYTGGNWISLSFQRMNFLVADRIVSSRGVNIQLWASGAILHYKDSEELLHLLATECNDNFHFCSNVQTIPPRPFKTFFTRFNLHMKGDNISKESCFKFRRKLVSVLCPLCQRTGLILYLKARQPEDDPFVGVIEFSVFIHRWKIQPHTQQL